MIPLNALLVMGAYRGYSPNFLGQVRRFIRPPNPKIRRVIPVSALKLSWGFHSAVIWGYVSRDATGGVHKL
jgi:hypothetical protein